jgi:deoxycytidylate deaminase
MAQQDPEYLGYYPGAELVFAIVCPLGTPYKRVVEALGNHLRQFGYKTVKIQVSDYFDDLLVQLGSDLKADGDDPQAIARHKIAAGNNIRQLTHKNDIMARVAAGAIADRRNEENKALGRKSRRSFPLTNTAYIISTVRRPEEATTLRRIYRKRVLPSWRQRFAGRPGALPVRDGNPRRRRRATHGDRRQGEGELRPGDPRCVPDGRRLSVSDPAGSDYADQSSRFLNLLFGCPTLTPTPQEQAMFMAYAASLRSGDLSRQVGAAIIDSHGDLISVGCNEAPKYGAGLYDPPTAHTPSHRDIELGDDSNELEKEAMADRIVQDLGGGVERMES